MGTDSTTVSLPASHPVIGKARPGEVLVIRCKVMEKDSEEDEVECELLVAERFKQSPSEKGKKVNPTNPVDYLKSQNTTPITPVPKLAAALV